MNSWLVFRAFLKQRRWEHLFMVILFGVSTCAMLLLLSAEQRLKDQFMNDAVGIDIVVGAKGSPLQLVLAAVYHLDAPTGNISQTDAEELCKNPAIKRCIPLALGDSYKGFRIVGTDVPLFLARHQLTTAPLTTTQVVVGHLAAKEAGLKAGDTFIAAHGLTPTPEENNEEHHAHKPAEKPAAHKHEDEHHGHDHSGHPYTVLAVLPPSGTVTDRLILTPTASVQQLHGESQDITALLVQTRNKRDILTLPRLINTTTNLQAAHPATEVVRLYGVLGNGFMMMRVLIGLLLATAAITFWFSMRATIQQRLPDLALLRIIGWRARKVAGLLALEIISVIGLSFALGLLLAATVIPFVATFSGVPVGALSSAYLFMPSVLLGGVASVMVSVMIGWALYRLYKTSPTTVLS